jgi:hypothetical protein
MSAESLIMRGRRISPRPMGLVTPVARRRSLHRQEAWDEAVPRVPRVSPVGPDTLSAAIGYTTASIWSPTVAH